MDQILQQLVTFIFILGQQQVQTTQSSVNDDSIAESKVVMPALINAVE